MPKPRIDNARHARVHDAVHAAARRYETGDYAGVLEITRTMLPLVAMYEREVCFSALADAHASAALMLAHARLLAGQTAGARALLESTLAELVEWPAEAQLVRDAIATMATLEHVEAQHRQPPWALRREPFWQPQHTAEA